MYQLRTNGSGVPLVLNGTGGHVGYAVQRVASTHDGLVQSFDTVQGGYEFHTLDPSLEEPNNAVTAAAQVALTQVWLATQYHYTASVSTATKSVDGSALTSGLTRALPTTGSHFGWAGQGTAQMREIRFEDSGGSLDSDSGEVATRVDGTTTANGSGFHKTGLALIGETGTGTDVWRVTGGFATGGPNTSMGNGVRKMEWDALTGLDLGTPDEGSRTVAVGGMLVDGANSASGLISSLVPSIADEVLDMAYNPNDSNLYFISRLTGGSPRVFLSAVSFPWDPSGDFANNSIATIVDLDPDAADLFLELTYDASLNLSDLTGSDLLSASSLTFSPDGSRLFVANGPAGDRVFQFDLFVEAPPIPEPSTAILLTLGMLALGGRTRRKRG